MSQYRVNTGMVSVETTVNDRGGRAQVDFYRGAFLPGDAPREQIETLLRLGHIVDVDTAESGEEESELDTPPRGAPTGLPELPDGMSVAATLDWVGKDAEKARLALAAETAEGGPNRATAVQRLEAVIAAAETDGAGPPSE